MYYSVLKILRPLYRDGLIHYYPAREILQSNLHLTEEHIPNGDSEAVIEVRFRYSELLANYRGEKNNRHSPKNAAVFFALRHTIFSEYCVEIYSFLSMYICI